MPDDPNNGLEPLVREILFHADHPPLGDINSPALYSIAISLKRIADWLYNDALGPVTLTEVLSRSMAESAGQLTDAITHGLMR